jgi:hypothetical protein
MAYLNYQATRNANNSHSVAAAAYVIPQPNDEAPQDPIGSAAVAVVIDATKSKIEIMDALRAITHRLIYEGDQATEASNFSTTATTVE